MKNKRREAEEAIAEKEAKKAEKEAKKKAAKKKAEKKKVGKRKKILEWFSSHPSSKNRLNRNIETLYRIRKEGLDLKV